MALRPLRVGTGTAVVVMGVMVLGAGFLLGRGSGRALKVAGELQREVSRVSERTSTITERIERFTTPAFTLAAPEVRVTLPASPDSDNTGTGRVRERIITERIGAERVLTAEMAVNRTTVSPGESIVYTVTITNLSERPVRDMTILSHVPEHTTLCNTPEAELEGDDVAVCVPAPRIGGPADHSVRATYTKIAPGETIVFAFKVDVEFRAPEGTMIRNHAHAEGLRAPRVDSGGVETTVR